MKKELHFIILAGGFQDSSLLMPQALLPLGHHPMVCILIKTLLALDHANIHVHVIASKTHQILFQREMRRWFPSDQVHVVGTLGSTTAESLLEFLDHRQWADDVSCFVLQSNCPLLSGASLEHFIHVSSHSPSAVLGMNKTKWNEDRALHNVRLSEQEKDRVVRIDHANFEHVGFLGCTKCTVGLLRNHLPGCSRYFEMLEHMEEKPLLVKVSSFPVELDSIQIRSTGDKTFAEHKFMEKQHADYLSQCYCIWKECKQMEERLQTIERQLKK